MVGICRFQFCMAGHKREQVINLSSIDGLTMVREVKVQVWLANEGGPFLGEREAQVLSSLEEQGTVEGASYRTGLSDKEVMEAITSVERGVQANILGSNGLTEEGRKILQEYRAKSQRIIERADQVFRNPSLTVDGVVIKDGKIVLIRRGRDPGRGLYALPGGFVEYGESVENSVVREVWEETGLETEPLDLVGVYSDPSRDPRGHIVSLVFLLRAVGGELRAGDDAETVGVFDLADLPPLAFDHTRIVSDLLASKGRSSYR